MTENISEPTKEEDEPPPFLRTWKRIYSAVLWYLIVLITVLYALTRIFALSSSVSPR